MEVILNNETALFRLRKIQKSDLEFAMHLRNDAETLRFLGDSRKVDLSSQLKWFDSLSHSKNK